MLHTAYCMLHTAYCMLHAACSYCILLVSYSHAKNNRRFVFEEHDTPLDCEWNQPSGKVLHAINSTVY
jgi:hypothetical protein